MAEETKYTQHFKEAYRNGFKPKALSRSKWLYDCTQAAIRDLDDVGDFRKTSGGALFYLLQRPSTHVVPLIKDTSIKLRKRAGSDSKAPFYDRPQLDGD